MRSFVDEKVGGGFYGTASEVGEGLRLLTEHDRQPEIDIGFQESERVGSSWAKRPLPGCRA